MEIPRDIPAAPLCKTIARAKMRTSLVSPEIPTARPSKIECVPRPINRTKGVMLATHDGLASSTV
jgi:hypothetical protein